MEGSDTGIFGLTPSTMALLVIVVLLILWASYTWYYGGVTVPLPSYAVGFQGSEKKKEGFVGLEEEEEEGFEGEEKEEEESFLGGRFGATNTNKKPRDLKKNAKLPRHTSKGVKQGPNPAASGTFPRHMEGFGSRSEPYPTRKGVEGFGGASHGAGSPSCLRSSAESAQLVDMFVDKNPRFEEGPDALRELTILMGKLACFKKDLVSPSYIVSATRNQPYTTAHDIEPIAETTGRCFSKTISPRDLTISLDKWNQRGESLVKKLCTAYSLGQKEVEHAQGLFRHVIRDVSDVARSSCLQGEPMIAGKPGPRDAHPYEKAEAVEYGEFKGYY